MISRIIHFFRMFNSFKCVSSSSCTSLLRTHYIPLMVIKFGDFVDVFEKRNVNCLPKYLTYDYLVDLKEYTFPPFRPIYIQTLWLKDQGVLNQGRLKALSTIPSLLQRDPSSTSRRKMDPRWITTSLSWLP